MLSAANAAKRSRRSAELTLPTIINHAGIFVTCHDKHSRLTTPWICSSSRGFICFYRKLNSMVVWAVGFTESLRNCSSVQQLSAIARPLWLAPVTVNELITQLASYCKFFETTQRRYRAPLSSLSGVEQLSVTRCPYFKRAVLSSWELVNVGSLVPIVAYALYSVYHCFFGFPVRAEYERSGCV